ncbi:hypothetical protein [Microbacterium maritypicum]
MGGTVMGGLVTETVRPGVQFIPDAAAAFRRADAQVRAEFGRGIRVASTFRSWANQMLMFVNWNRYVAGLGPHPGHSKAVHPSESFHVQGLALDSPDWTIPRIVQILAENGFVRNRLHVKNEEHHFEWLRDRDKNYGRPPATAGGASTNQPSEEDDMYTDDKHREVLTASREILLYKMGTGVVAVGDGGFWPLPSEAYLELLIAWEIAGPNVVKRTIDQNELTAMLALKRTLSPMSTGAAEKVEAVLNLTAEDAERIAASIGRRPVVISESALAEIAKAAAAGAREGGESGAAEAINGLSFVTTIAG